MDVGRGQSRGLRPVRAGGFEDLCATCLANLAKNGKITVRITIHKDVSALIPEPSLSSLVTASSQNSLQYYIIISIIHLYTTMYIDI